MTINQIYKEILKAYENKDISFLKQIICGNRIYEYADVRWFYLEGRNYKYRITVKNGLTSAMSRIKRPISQEIFDWLSNSELNYCSV